MKSRSGNNKVKNVHANPNCSLLLLYASAVLACAIILQGIFALELE